MHRCIPQLIAATTAWGAGWLLLSALAAVPAWAQFTLEGRPVQIHGFASQGFAYSNTNNYLSMDTSQGSFAFTDGGLNVTSQLSEKLRVGAQMYVRNVGHLGQGQVTLDWASLDYHGKDWFGIRAGKVKTPLGLYNDVQDAEFLHTWALLPQAVYPLDLRDTYLAHEGLDIYGNVGVRKFGQLAYTGYAGIVPRDPTDGYEYSLRVQGYHVNDFSKYAIGVDGRWTTPITGLVVGASTINSPMDVHGGFAGSSIPATVKQQEDNRTILYARYVFANLQIEGEYCRDIEKLQFVGFPGPLARAPQIELDRRAWYAALSYRVSKRLELGAYNSRFFPNADKPVGFTGVVPAPVRHIFDQTVAARVDLSPHLDLKLEGHFIDGYGDLAAAQGFYPQDNPRQLVPKTNLLVVRLGFNF